ncbi:UDP-N-acetylglucosamine--N-acetylmuramyl-(pentapeptide) pyrophosphoryl-undecaprenol N-acetylglucosamine transferase [subsurface metagenome]
MLAGGGTGGHLFPALAIARGLREMDDRSDIRFVGSRYGLEARVLSGENEVFYPLNIRGIQRGLGPVSLGRNLIFPWRFAVSRRRCRQIMNEFEPHVVVGTGGYASGLPLMAAQKRGIPTLIHEQNAYPGMTTRRLAQRANVVCLTYESSAQYIHASKWVLTGNPVRFNCNHLPSRKTAREQLGLPPRGQVVFILGGSQGSRPLNNHFLGHWRTYTDKMMVHLLWQTGTAHYERLRQAIGTDERVTLIPFITDMAAAFMAADLVVSRAGAMTLAELTYLGRPSVLVPLPTAAADHQTLNAQVLVKKKAARLVSQSELSRGTLEKQVERLIKNPDWLEAMGKRAQSLAQPDAAETIVKHILELAEE